MKPIVKIILGVLGTLVALLVIAAISLTTLVDPNDYKEEITTAVYDATGRSLDFKGDMSLTFFPWFGISIGEVSMENPQEFGGGTFASISSAKASVKVLPLFYRKIEFSDFVLDGLTLHLIKNEKGAENWKFTPPQKEVVKPKRRGSIIESPPSKQTNNKAIPEDSTALAALFIESLSVSNTMVTYDDKRTGASYAIKDLSLKSSALRPGEKFTLNIQGMAESQQPAIQSPFKATIEATPAENLSQVDVAKTNIVLEPKGESIPSGQATIQQSSSFTVNLKDKSVSIHEAELTAYTATLNMKGELNYAKNLDFRGSLNMNADYRQVAKKMGVSPPEPANNNSELILSMQVEVVPDSVALSDIQGSLSGYPLNGDFQYYFGDKPELKVRLYAEHIELDPYLTLLKRIQSGATIPEETQADSSAPQAEQTQPAEPAKQIEQPKQPAQAAPAKQPEPVKQPKQTKQEKPKQPSPIKPRVSKLDQKAEQNLEKAVAPQTLAKLNAVVDIAIKKIVIDSIPVTDVKIEAKGKDGVITVTPLNFNVFGGKVTSSVKSDLRGTLPVSSMKVVTDKMNLAEVSKTLFKAQHVSGTAFLDASMSAYGFSWDTVRRTLNGKALFNATDGTLTGINFLPPKTLDLFKGSKRKKIESSLTAQPYKVMRGTVFAKNGRLSNNDFMLDAQELTAKGSGFANLATDSVHYRADLQFDNLPLLPVQISGKLSAPVYSVDMKRFLGKSIQDFFKPKEGEEETNPLKRLEKGIRNLFK